jgi:hypothetical protein
MHKINLPLAVYLTRKTMPDKKMIINLNNYRNWSYIVSNQVKKAYCQAVEPLVRGLILEPRLSLVFTYYKGSKRISDRSNVLCVHEKFFLDALVELGCIEDDNDSFIKSTHFDGDKIDIKNPRVEVLIMEGMK